ncbi:MAG: tetratricopeptide repeat protein [Bacteroidetes bacterium]|nr:tetratricopeptide repeat protein [Bacteroidota bacterium]
MKSSAVTLFLLIFFSFQSHAQDPRRIDSLVGALKSVRPDTNRANLLYAISKAYWGVDGIKSIEYANQCMELSKRLKYAKGIGDAWNSIGVNHDDKGELQEASAAYQNSLEVRLKAGLKMDIGRSYGNLAILYRNMGNEPQSLDYVFKALKILEEVGDKVNMLI